MLRALALTIVLEGAGMLVYARVARRLRPDLAPEPPWRYAYYSLLLNLLTNPLLGLLLWLIFLAGGRGWYTLFLWVLEVCVVLGEGLLYAKLCGWPRRRALLVSLALNGLSLAAGLVINAL